MLKQNTVSKFYWGRGNLYKKSLHLIVLALTGLVFFTGVSTRLFGLSNSNVLQASSQNLGDVDVLEQGGSLESVLASNPDVTFNVYEYTVQNGDTLQSVADKFKVSKDTIKWANYDKFSSYTAYSSEKINPNDKLAVPEINGVLYNVKADDTLDKVLDKTSGNKFEVIEINQLEGPEYSLKGVSRLLIPQGKLKAPERPSAPIIAYKRPTPTGNFTSGNGQALNSISFSNPLADPACRGYVWMRGFAAWHNGVDLAKNGGCPIRSACNGVVEQAGWENGGQGFNVRVNCGNGVQVSYYHSDGNIGVRKGDSVVKGQFLMYMGRSGNATGVHLHLGMRLNGIFIDPSPYIPY